MAGVVRSNFTRLKAPLKFSYAVTYRCNLRCKMCNIWDKEHVQKELEPQVLARFLERPHQTYWLGITGGEPFLREDLTELVEGALKVSPSIQAVHFASNGAFTSRMVKLVETVRSHYPRVKLRFTISIDGYPELHDRIRGVPGAWTRALQTFKALRQIDGVKPQFGFTLSHQNIDQFEATYAALREAYAPMRFDDLTVNIFQKSSFYYENQDLPALDPEQTRRAITQILAMDDDRPTSNNFLRRRYLRLYLTFLQTRKSPVRCQAMSSSCYVDPYGNLFPCGVYDRKLLNIAETNLSLKEIWALPEAKQIHQECATNHCPRCWSPCDAYSAIGGSLVQSLFKG